MSMILYSCLTSLNINLEIGLDSQIDQEVAHLSIPDIFKYKADTYRGKIGVVSSALLVISNLSSLWSERPDILNKVISLN